MIDHYERRLFVDIIRSKIAEAFDAYFFPVRYVWRKIYSIVGKSYEISGQSRHIFVACFAIIFLASTSAMLGGAAALFLGSDPETVAQDTRMAGSTVICGAAIAILSVLAIIKPIRFPNFTVDRYIYVGKENTKGIRQAAAIHKRINYHIRLLGMSVGDFAARANLSRIEAWILLRRTDLLLKPKVERAIEDALFLPKGFLRRGGGGPDRRQYGQKYTIERLRWYDEQGLAKMYMLAGNRYDRVSSSKLSAILRSIEQQRRFDLKLPEETS